MDAGRGLGIAEGGLSGRKAGGEGSVDGGTGGHESHRQTKGVRGKKTSVRKRHMAQPRRDGEEGHGGL